MAADLEVVAIGTGGKRYAAAFIEDESVPFPVLLDEDGSAARLVGTNSFGAGSLMKPGQYVAGLRSTLGGHRQRNAGRRPLQLGATLVVAPGDELLYSDFEDYAGDHADLDAVLTAARG